MGRATTRLSALSILSCAVAGAVLSCTLFLCQTPAVAQNAGAAAKTDTNALLEALIKQDEEKRAREPATGKDRRRGPEQGKGALKRRGGRPWRNHRPSGGSKGGEGQGSSHPRRRRGDSLSLSHGRGMRPVPQADLRRVGVLEARLCVDLADVPCLRAEIPGADARHGRHLLRALPPAGRHPARREARNAAVGAQPDLARRRDLHHLPPRQGAVRQGQRRAPGRAGQDHRADLRHRRQERAQGHPRQQGNLLRQDQQGRAGHGHPQRHDDEPAAHQVGVLRQLPPGGRQPRHQARDRVGPVSRQPGTQGRRHLPGLPHGQGARKA